MNMLKLGLVYMILLSLPACKNQTDLTDQTNKNSYAIGTQIGESLKAQKLDINSKALAAGVADAMNEQKVLTKDQIQQALLEVQKQIALKREDGTNANQSASVNFLKQNESKPQVHQTKSGLQYRVEKEGSGKTPSLSSTVVLNYKGTLIDGTEFDNSYKRNQSLEIKVSQSISGWQEALQLMNTGSKYTFFVPPSLGYGSLERPGIPAGSVLIYEIELLEVK